MVFDGLPTMRCRGPPEEAIDPKGDFQQTQAKRFLEIDSFDALLSSDLSEG